MDLWHDPWRDTIITPSTHVVEKHDDFTFGHILRRLDLVLPNGFQVCSHCAHEALANRRNNS